jgi:hypothetical protein
MFRYNVQCVCPCSDTMYNASAHVPIQCTTRLSMFRYNVQCVCPCSDTMYNASAHVPIQCTMRLSMFRYNVQCVCPCSDTMHNASAHVPIQCTTNNNKHTESISSALTPGLGKQTHSFSCSRFWADVQSVGKQSHRIYPISSALTPGLCVITGTSL